MKYDFTNIKVDTKADKAIPKLRHSFEPLENDKDIVVECDYFQAGEKSKYLAISADGNVSFDHRKIFKNKVRDIRGFVISVTDSRTGKTKDVDIRDADTFLQYPDMGVFNEILSSVALHLILADGLTETEVKNSNGAIEPGEQG